MVGATPSVLALAALLGASGPAFASTGAPCVDLVPMAAARSPARPLAPHDLVRLRDIGPVDPFAQSARFFTVSPDGRRVAFQLRRADPARNAYCLAMVVLELEPGARPRIVDQGGELIRVSFDFRGKAAFPTGIGKAITPRWSPDGKWIAFLRRDGGVVQVWRADADGKGSAPVTRSATDVDDFRIGADGRTIVFTSRPALREARQAIEREGLSGFHYDDRYAPAASNRPFPAAPVQRAAFVQSLDDRGVREASDAEAALLDLSDMREGVWAEAQGPGRRRAWLGTDRDANPPTRGRLNAEDEAGRTIPCQGAACAGASRPWWTTSGRVRFLRREGWADASTAIYEWIPGRGAPRRLYVTDDVLADCAPLGDALLCLREGSLTPRRLERLDPADGRRAVAFDPNPEFSALRLGSAERLHLRNRFGLESIADLVLPPGYRKGARYPLVVVQYDTRGFLRGGTGDEYPIQAFANRGYAVLSISRPRSAGFRSGITDFVEVDRLNLIDFADRRSALSSVEAGVRLAIARGIADPARIGITGMSDGGATAAFALLHSNLFSAVAMSGCCFDTTLPMRVGPAAAREFHRMGFPKMTDTSREAQAFWSQLALSKNAARIATPVLLQISDDELMSALESYTALREAGAPIDMFVFPGEHHVKWQPAHRLAVYRRSLDWFDYWLRGIRSQSPDRAAELRHWEALQPPVRPAE